ncbi:MAG: hypothetical protein J7604_25010 [Sporocytophaga sp.]|uniref:hypothetical protein n=1 Tax=Sporocytophaga sp. TaxID=2231183 RepID=UPI001B0B1E8F|nr:hypothetical protein [Sporocytophaga sp.]MBO9703492.1 hypothetical protein [Sporocytophaga sp.]
MKCGKTNKVETPLDRVIGGYYCRSIVKGLYCCAYTSSMDKWRETLYRITKYNPDNRNGN